MKRIFVSLYTGLLFVSAGCKTKNSFLLTVDPPLKIEQVQVKLEIIYHVPLTTIFNGSLYQPVPDGYGENDWQFIYRDSLVGGTRFIKTNRNDHHDYTCRFFEENGVYKVAFRAKGIGTFSDTVELKVKAAVMK
ncbi:hypothetical protein LZZ85_15535 [Terrimonas sp. NA20]|uniref:PKD domain-containing protein n=1 Tax=Terrimonas ginsenosidimutans TaxID=2908004 RepID=A0ABS9KTQ1_9BACT|nr:hypothetical protein [Terrimonas ginsenosidimutans]MCG2615712.1 hypothetical protein [Terrimonas ginsenosidimutans]